MQIMDKETWKNDLPAFREKTEAFYAGDVKM